MAAALEISDQAGETWAHQAGTLRRGIHGSIVDLFALVTPTGMRAKPDHGDHLARHEQIDLLEDFGRILARHDGSMTIGTFDAVQVDEIDFVVGKRFTLMKLMPWLCADLAFLAVFGWSFRFLDKIAGGRLGRVA